MTLPSTEPLGAEPVPLPVPVSELGEGPVWVAAETALYWVDIPAGRVHRLAGDGGHASWEVGAPAGAVVPRAGGGLVVAAGTGFVTLEPATGAVAPLAGTTASPADARMNDGACDLAGRFYAGTMAHDEAPGGGTLYRLDPDRSVTEIYPRVGVSNGIGWSPDNRQMYYIDSLEYRVDVMDYDPLTGQIGERRPFAAVGAGDVQPDGLAVDSDGGLWVAVWGGGMIQRLDPAGRPAGQIRLPAANVTSCAFGGPDMDRLYITTAAGPGRLGGTLFGCLAGVPGLPAHPFRG